MLTDLSWFKSLKWILGIAVASGLVFWFFLFQFPYYDSFTIFIEEQFPFIGGLVLVTLLGFQFGFLPVERFIKRQRKLNLYLQRIKRLGQTLSQASTREELMEELISRSLELFPYEDVAVFEYNEEDQSLDHCAGDQEGLSTIRSRSILDDFQEQKVEIHGEGSPFSVWDWPVAVSCPVTGLTGSEYLVVLKITEENPQETFHRILGRMMGEQVGEALRQIEQLEREQAIQNQLNEEIERNTREIRQQRRFLSSILDSLEEGLIVVNEDDEIERINPKALELLGSIDPGQYAQLSELSGYLPDEIFDNRAQEQPRSVKFEDRTFEYEWHSVENTDSTLLVFRDRTEMEKLQEQLRINETLSTLGEMASAIVHELRNPLGGMEIYLGLLKRKSDNEELEKPIRQLEQGFKSIQNTTETLLNYTKTSHPTPEDINPNQLMEAALEQCRETIKAKNVTVNKEIPELPAIRGDFEQLHSVFVNLIRNGIEAQEDSPRLDITGKEEESYVSLSVRDRGVGMDDEEKRNVFKRFFTTKQDGTGLGLAICKRMVEMHSGEIGVESTPGEGSTFTVRLPVDAGLVGPEQEEET